MIKDKYKKDSDLVLVVSAGMDKIKKDYMKRDLENYYLNYGALGLATILKKKQYNVKMYQGDYTSAKEFVDSLPDLSNTKYPVLLSIPSFLAIQWCIDFSRELKEKYPNIKIVAGGRWVLDFNYDWCKSKLPNIDKFVFGCGEEYIEDILDYDVKKIYKGDAPPFKDLDYTILNNYKQYQPVIEVARGCFGKCDFCLESRYKTYNIKKPEDVISEAIKLCDVYQDKHLNIYFESAIFNPDEEWSKKFSELYNQKNLKFKWRATTRVDVFNKSNIAYLSKAGLKVLDLGLESASKKQLLAMGKTKNPEIYLSKASELIDGLYKYNVWSKLNILLYLNENEETIAETTSWLNEHRDKIKGLSVNPLTIYLNGENTYKYIDEISKTLKINIDTKELNKKGYMYIPLSSNINIEKAKSISKRIADDFMSKEDFLDLKKICYTKRIYNSTN